ncbi:hypothetical protein GCM10009777_05470 [Microbacterium pumilum]|uniref:Peptidase S11 D-alanyl-D-alanine carboxypeptidase A N-terminal domain-containing protein n=2 Tax=Microbacterium pumilum TaxID=344165 RepID=A0ABN2RV66_9MICO
MDAAPDPDSSDTVLTLEHDRESASSQDGEDPVVDPDSGGRPAYVRAPSATPTRERSALLWVDEASVGTTAGPVADLSTATTPFVPVGNDLLADLPRRSPLRASVIVPTLIGAGLVGAYAATTLLWPLYAVAPTVTAMEVQPVPAPAAAMTWPATGSAAVSVNGITGMAASSPDPFPMASITKVVTALAVLDEMPLAVGEQGPSFQFSYADSLAYWNALAQNESALDVPVGGSLTEYELLEGMLIGSAGNYAERLAGNLWPSDAVYADAANSWLRAHGVEGVTVVEPTGMDRGNTASPSALIPLAQKALANPVIAEIVAKQAVDLPGAGNVVNTNGLLADPGVLGIKTGTLDGYNLLSAKDVTIGDTTVRLYASVLGQPDDASRLAASRALYTQLETQLQPAPSVTAGTTTALVETVWGEEVDVVTADDASVILWNGGTGTVSTSYSLGDSRADGDVVGSLSVGGPLDQTTVDLKLADDVEGPTAWWRLTHPLELFGLTD